MSKKTLALFELPGGIPLLLNQWHRSTMIFEIADLRGGWSPSVLPTAYDYAHNPYGPAIVNHESPGWGSFSSKQIDHIILWMRERIQNNDYDPLKSIDGNHDHCLFGTKCDRWRHEYKQIGFTIDELTRCMSIGLKAYPSLVKDTIAVAAIASDCRYRKVYRWIEEAQTVSIEDFLTDRTLLKARILICLHEAGLIVQPEMIFENLKAIIALGYA